MRISFGTLSREEISIAARLGARLSQLQCKYPIQVHRPSRLAAKDLFLDELATGVDENIDAGMKPAVASAEKPSSHGAQ